MKDYGVSIDERHILPGASEGSLSELVKKKGVEKTRKKNSTKRESGEKWRLTTAPWPGRTGSALGKNPKWRGEKEKK